MTSFFFFNSCTTSNTRNMKQELNLILKNGISNSDFRIQYKKGNSFSGETDFNLDSDGTCEVWSTVTKGRLKKSFEGQLLEEEIQELLKMFLSAKLWKTKHNPSKQREDDSLASIIVFVGEKKYDNSLWVSEIRNCPNFDNPQQAILRIIKNISKGEILENGR